MTQTTDEYDRVDVAHDIDEGDRCALLHELDDKIAEERRQALRELYTSAQWEKPEHLAYARSLLLRPGFLLLRRSLDDLAEKPQVCRVNGSAHSRDMCIERISPSGEMPRSFTCYVRENEHRIVVTDPHDHSGIRLTSVEFAEAASWGYPVDLFFRRATENEERYFRRLIKKKEEADKALYAAYRKARERKQEEQADG